MVTLADTADIIGIALVVAVPVAVRWLEFNPIVVAGTGRNHTKTY